MKNNFADKKINIAIDGPSGSGKSTAAKLVAGLLGVVYVDTGAMYRAVALHCLKNSVSPGDEKAVIDVLPQVTITIKYHDGGQILLLNGKDVTSDLRTQEVAGATSRIAMIGPVRQKLVAMQQELARNTSVVMDGRDIGTCVLPDADVKIYLEATPGNRTRRRMGELYQKGIISDFETIKSEIIKRDYDDAHREISPLCKAKDAIVIESDLLTPNQVADRIIGILNQKLSGGNR